MRKVIALWLLAVLLMACGTVSAPLSASPAARAQTLTVLAPDVGKADAFLIQTERCAAVIDTATEEAGDALVGLLRARGVETIDALYITHFDRDHVGGADRLIDAFDVRAVYTGPVKKESADVDEFFDALSRKGLTSEVVAAPFSYEADGAVYEVYPPQREAYEKKESNNASLVIRVTFDGRSILFAGDAEEERIDELLAMDGLASDVLKLPHHGQREDNTAALLDHISPAYAIITSSDEEPEDEKTLKLLQKRGIETYLTRNGDIEIALSAEGIQISRP